MRRALGFIGFTAVIASPLQAQTDPIGIVGRWTQASSGKEMVLAPQIKLVPNVGVSAGTSLGGSVGHGSMTRTTIVTQPVMMDVSRSMTLVVAGDGRFDWSIVRSHREKDGCAITTTQEKNGRLGRSGAKLIFAIERGTESFSTTCGRQGTSALGASTERYDLAQVGGRLELVHGVNRWRFERAR